MRQRRLTVSAAAVQRGLGLPGGDVEEAVHEEGEVGPGSGLRPGVHSGEICREKVQITISHRHVTQKNLDHGIPLWIPAPFSIKS